MNLIPPIGASGLYRLGQPFDTKVNLNIGYTCMAVRKISDIQALGIDPYAAYYEPYDIPEAKYKEDAASGVCIISLQSGGGIWVYVPSSYIESYPQLNGVPYVGVALMLHLGALPDSLNLTYIKTLVNDVVSASLGVVPQDVQTIVTTPKTLVSQDNHMAAESTRQQNITNNTTDYARLQQYANENAELRSRIAHLERYILTNMPPAP